MSLRILLSCLLLSLSCSAFADTVWLNNGDRLTGEILLLDGGKLSFKTKYAGRVLIDWKDIDTLSADKPLMLRRTGRDSESSERLRAAGAHVKTVSGQRQQEKRLLAKLLLKVDVKD